MPDRAVWGLDASEYFQVAQRVEATAARVAKSHVAHNESFLRSGHRVAAQFGHVAREIASGGDIAGASIEGMARAMNLPLGALAGLAAGGAIIGAMVKNAREAHQALKDLNKEIAQHSGSKLEFASEEQLHAQLEKETQLFKTAKDKESGILAKSRGFFSTFNPIPNIENIVDDLKRLHAGQSFEDVSSPRRKIRADERDRVNKIAGDIVKRAQQETAAAREAATGSVFEAQRIKAVEEAESKIYAIRTDKTLKNHADRKRELEKEVEEEKNIRLAAIDRAEKREKILNESAIRVANFRGSAEQMVSFALKEQLDTWQKILAISGNETERAKARLEIAKTEKEIYQNTLEQRLKSIDRSSATAEGRVRRREATAGVDQTDEQRRRSSLQSDVDLAMEALRAANQRAAAVHFSADSVQAQLAAYTKLVQAESALTVYDKEIAFEHEQTLNAAKATTAELALQSTGQDYLASVARIRSDYESKIAKAIHDGREDLVGQFQAQEKLEVAARRFQRWKETGGNPDQPTPQERAAKIEREKFDQSERDLVDRSRRGGYVRHPA